MTKPIRYHRDARADYREAASWYQDRREGSGVEFIERVAETLKDIAAMPHAGLLVADGGAGKVIRRRRVRRFSHYIIYRETPSAIRVLAVAHTSREPGYWLGRL